MVEGVGRLAGRAGREEGVLILPRPTEREVSARADFEDSVMRQLGCRGRMEMMGRQRFDTR